MSEVEKQDDIYELYRIAKKLIERTQGCQDKDHSHEPVFKEWQEAIEIFDSLGRGYAERYEKEKAEGATKSIKEKAAFDELKTEMVKLMFAFTDKYSSQGENCLYPRAGQILVDVLMACLQDAQYQIKGHPQFTSKQIDHICYQIGEWYLGMKPLLQGQHNLGHMKERLKVMICGDER